MPTVRYEITINGTPEQIDGAVAALDARLGGVRRDADRPDMVWTTIDALDSADAHARVDSRIGSLPADVAGRLRFRALPADA